MPAASTAGRANRAAGSKSAGSLMITLKLPPAVLQQFAADGPDRKPSNPTLLAKTQDRSSPASSAGAAPVRPSSADNGSDLDATSTPATGATPGDTPRRKGVPGPKPGNKRANGQAEPAARARGRPGPKKKPRL